MVSGEILTIVPNDGKASLMRYTTVPADDK